MKLIKYLLSIIMCLMLVGGWHQTASAEAAQSGKAYKVVVMDRANLLTETEEKQLAAEMQELTQYGNVVFSTVKLKNKVYEKYAENTYYQLFGREPGVLFQIDMGNRKLTLSCSTQMEELLHSERDSIVDNIYTLATEKKYYACASKCFQQIKLVLNDGEIAHDMKHINNAIFALILGLIINFIVVSVTSRKKISLKKLLGEMGTAASISNVVVNKGNVTKTYAPRSSGSSSSGGGGSSGGSSGGGFSGGSSSHGF